MNEEQPQVNTDAQRRALDVMSARLLDNLNTMIAEQEARVQEFSRQQNSLSPLPQQESAPAVQQPAPSSPVQTEHVSPAAPKTASTAPRHARSVTPPPIKAKKQPQPHHNVPKPPLPKGPVVINGEEKKESSVGCGPIAVIVVIIIILLRACS